MASRTPVALSSNSFEPVQGIQDQNPIIFLHAVTVSKEYWKDIPQVVANATGRKTYALDARNHGDSPWSDVFDFEITVDDLLHFMDRVNIPKAILVGHSMGGITAIKTALLHPNRVERLIAEDVSVRKSPQVLLNFIVTLLRLAKEAVKLVPYESTMDEAKQFVVDYVSRNAPNKAIKSIAYKIDDPRLLLKRNPSGEYDFKCYISKISDKLADGQNVMTDPKGVFGGPACFIYGRKSPFLVGQDEHIIRKHFPNVKMVGIEDTLHNVHQENALLFTDALLLFIQGGWNKI